MILYRALNNDNVEKLKNGENISCSLYNSYTRLMKDKADLFDMINKTKSENVKRKCFKKFTDTELKAYNYFFDSLYYTSVVANALDLILGHVSGAKLKNGTSPWISTSTDLPFVISEYSVPQAGNYNTEKDRKPVAIINYDDSKIYSTVERLREIRDKVNNFDFAVDLRKDRLCDYFDNDVVMAEKANLNLRGRDPAYSFNRDFAYRTKLKGFVTYATKASEVLIHGFIKKDNIVTQIYPFFQDVIYSCRLDVTYNIDAIIKNYDNLMTIMAAKIRSDKDAKELYPSLTTGTNLSDFLIQNYSSIEGNTAEEKYRNAMIIKYNILKDIVSEIRKYKILAINDPSRLLDTGLYFNSIECLTKLILTNSKKRMTDYMNDLIVIEKNGSFYIYDSNNKGYVNISNSNDIIRKEDLLRLKHK